MRGFLACLLPALFIAGPAQAAFECLPGPAQGGLGDWAWPDGERPGVHASVALGRPASIGKLIWSQAVAGWHGRRFSLSGDVYSLGLEDLYRESSAGLWFGFRSIGAGIRAWRAAWDDGTSRAGWTCEGDVRRSRGPFAVRFALQGLPLGKGDSCAPEERFCLAADLRAGADLLIGAAAIRSATRSILLGRLRWSPLPRFTLSETLIYPGSTARSGIEIGIERLSVGLWVEPSERLGLRTGVLCSAP
jgi:hypothetical protein